MPSVFNIVRGSVYLAVVLWTIIVLAIAVHFHEILLSSDLTRFIPFAIFVCSVSLLFFVALLGFGLWPNRNPISTKVELGCLGLAGVLWLALAAFVASSDAENADVECFSSADATEAVAMPGFNTETYQAQYRVLEAFSFFNLFLILGFLITLLVLAFREHRAGRPHVWAYSVTAYPWFAQKGKQNRKGLPQPVTSRSRSKSVARPSRSNTMPTRQNTMPTRQNTMQEKPRMERSMTERVDRGQRPSPPMGRTSPPVARGSPPVGRGRSPTRNESPTYVYWIPHKAPDQAHVREQRNPRDDKYHRNASPRR
ncbi:hypothetical protein CERSUDRAFT_80347 [Gelatoporia subvermispora B]|uniref:MARVEL domain-containing protein n=1 Tax=Ceriporiopsis subvermispora (strain B) TaxID=914234 RepID=M2R8G1_CERS8|nr:hypothetical protein CERSUDRAFT_80347 [Gelatoporia subvermispora B]